MTQWESEMDVSGSSDGLCLLGKVLGLRDFCFLSKIKVKSVWRMTPKFVLWCSRGHHTLTHKCVHTHTNILIFNHMTSFDLWLFPVLLHLNVKEKKRKLDKKNFTSKRVVTRINRGRQLWNPLVSGSFLLWRWIYSFPLGSVWTSRQDVCMETVENNLSDFLLGEFGWR